MTDDQDKYWMKIALKYAYHAKKKGEIPIGAILVLQEKIIGIGWNSSIIKNDPTAHAEIVALRQAGKNIKNYRLKNTTLYVTLEPCLMCFGAIIHSRISRLVFGASDKKDKKYLFKNIFLELQKKNKLKIQKNIMEYQCSQILINFFKNKRK
ncbi:tRNA adenosine(34) deaminase TadA [Buchnera aphidicola (Aphis helianthi)]|uniref:tRNA-specific adenosine deaminase n=1 Tax=Buchnera aphidicola (Aphis helianthi) TaxID=2315802 RepID=A0A4D6XQB4_9GAMM|nr:tRNA adenosine(34) deaminase TadA [Buchnera aphidicola]QCI17078.1 tRNA adenosine(34) deaminase TadA [Buchnera aphidicola (Aphis helianthi)]